MLSYFRAMDAARIEVERDQRIKLMLLQRHLYRRPYTIFKPCQIAPNTLKTSVNTASTFLDYRAAFAPDLVRLRLQCGQCRKSRHLRCRNMEQGQCLHAKPVRKYLCQRHASLATLLQ
jgi:hypothetical protein